MARSLCLTRRTADALLDDLLDSGLAFERGGYFQARSTRKTFHLSRIIAIEAKIDDWSGAIRQAAANTWFASESYILIPPKRVLDAVSQAAQDIGVGVLVFDGDETTVIVRSFRRRIPLSYGSWLLNERVVRGSEDVSTAPGS